MPRAASPTKTKLAAPTADARIQSVARAKALLDAMAAGEWVTLRDLATRTGLAKTTAFNLVTALVDVGLSERDAKAGAYRLSMQHLIYGKAVERRLDITEIARPHLIRLCATTRETVNLALPGPTDAMIIESLEGSQSLRVSAHAGTRAGQRQVHRLARRGAEPVNLALPGPTDAMIIESLEGSQSLRVSSYAGTRAAYHSTACGRALLAHQPESFRRLVYSIGHLPAATNRTITDPDALEAILERCRNIGWTTEYEENEIGGACVAAPIFNRDGEAVAAVSIAGPSSRFEPDAIERLGRLLVASLAEITQQLPDHYTPPGTSK